MTPKPSRYETISATLTTGPAPEHPTHHLPARRTPASITCEQHAEDHGELHHTAGHDPVLLSRTFGQW